MIPHSYPSPPRLVASGGPVSRALRIMQDADPAHPRLRDFRRSLARRIAADIALLDALSVDPDLEADVDFEPSLCGAASLNVQGLLPGEGGDDRELDAGDEPEEENEHGGDIQDERHDEEPAEDSLGSLGGTAASIDMAQIAWSYGASGDREPCIQDGPHDGDEREDGDDNGIADGGGAWEQYGVDHGLHGFAVRA